MTARVAVIAIDGPAGAGKSTTAKAVAAELGLSYLDTGALYRCVALTAIEQGIALDDGDSLAEIANALDVRFEAGGNGIRLAARDVTEAIRTPEVSDAASRVSAIPVVRAALVELQRRAARSPGTVAEGRDMGTVIFPDASLKVYLDASVDERARRRALDLERLGRPQGVAAVRDDISARDARDAGRTVAPLRIAPDAVVVDTTGRAFEAVVGHIVAEARRRGIGK
jgi:cytidylate kinase